MFWGILFIVITIFVISIIESAKKQKVNEKKFTSLGYSIDSRIYTGKYIAGHPEINDSVYRTTIYPKDGKLEIMYELPTKMPQKKGEIENSLIKNILVEDQSTVEKRVTVGRLLITGIFAFALKKKKKIELAYLIIEWNDGKFNHETIFEFEGKGAMQKANTARNKIIKVVR